MMPLLSVCVPTYNRPEKLHKLYDTFLRPAAEGFVDDLEVVVCDNSDEAIAAGNRDLLRDGRVRYVKNAGNLGFDGNLVQCLMESRGEYVWIISDDDDVDYAAFRRFVEWLRLPAHCKADIVMLPFAVDARISNTRLDWRAPEHCGLRDMLAGARMLPFILFSGAVLKVARHGIQSKVRSIADQFRGNDYIQCPLFLSVVEPEGEGVVFYHEPIQRYHPDYYGRFPLGNMVRSMERVIDWMGAKYRLDVREWHRKYHQGWLFWLHRHRIGLCSVRDAEQARGDILWKAARDYFGFKTLILLVLNLMPVVLAKQAHHLLVWYQNRRGA